MSPLLLVLFFIYTGDDLKDHANCPLHAAHSHSAGSASVDTRGDKVMGFSHQKSKHTFSLAPDGGRIEINANSANDAETRNKIRAHLKQVATRFAGGDFSWPKEIHGQVPPASGVLKARRNLIKYEYTETPKGAAVRITSTDADARKAIHSFLRFQITDHRTGDSLHQHQPR